ncbi:MAG: hypothetical protein QOK37_2190 [Thermoanaerobaculia bacterium]|nr:hypothetical protein [Thermoanaerobaculia bacterium]
MIVKKLLAVSLFLVSTSALANAHLVIRNTNAAGVGFNDPAPAAPVGGNSGTTIGQQRLIVFQRAADIWGSLIESKVDIPVDASFASLDCSATSAVLGQASAVTFQRNFENAPQQNVWYPIALASAIAGKDLASPAGKAHIRAQFNSQLDTPACLGGIGWYYGLDGVHGSKEDLLVVLLHELGHGLGFAGVTSGTSGAFFTSPPLPSVFEQHMLDLTANARWSEMTSVQRITSAINDQKVVWDGASTTTAALKFLGGTPTLKITAPTSLVKSYQINTAQFGPKISVAGVNGSVAAAIPNDGCTTITNPGAITGRIALVDRGPAGTPCTFVIKVKNAQLAGATAVIVADNVIDTIPGMGGTDATITIPSVGVSMSDGAAIRAAIPTTVTAILFADTSRLAGADTSGHPKLYVPTSLIEGSSMYHFDTSASPNLLMEPNISSDLPVTGVDLTLNQLFDIGWKPAVISQTGRMAGRRGH